jgi:two-component system LytT family response regulator
MKLRVLIVDDEPLVRESIRILLDDEPDVEIAGECANGGEAIEAIGQLSPDLIFLDVQMPEIGGFDVVEAIDPDRMPGVIFVTAYDEHALRAFEVDALDYLLKPFDHERFHRSVERARRQIGQKRAAYSERRILDLLADIGQAPQPKSASPYLERLVVKTAGRIIFVKTSQVDWVEATGDYMTIHAAGKTHLLRETMSGLESRLDPRQFLRIHRSTMVNIERVRELKPSFHGEYVVVLHDGTELKLSRSYRDRLQGLLGQTL